MFANAHDDIMQNKVAYLMHSVYGSGMAVLSIIADNFRNRKNL